MGAGNVGGSGRSPGGSGATKGPGSGGAAKANGTKQMSAKTKDAVSKMKTAARNAAGAFKAAAEKAKQAKKAEIGRLLNGPKQKPAVRNECIVDIAKTNPTKTDFKVQDCKVSPAADAGTWL